MFLHCCYGIHKCIHYLLYMLTANSQTLQYRMLKICGNLAIRFIHGCVSAEDTSISDWLFNIYLLISLIILQQTVNKFFCKKKIISSNALSFMFFMIRNRKIDEILQIKITDIYWQIWWFYSKTIIFFCKEKHSASNCTIIHNLSLSKTKTIENN